MNDRKRPDVARVLTGTVLLFFLTAIGPRLAAAGIAETDVAANSKLELLEKAVSGSYESYSISVVTREGATTLTANKDGTQSVLQVPLEETLALWRTLLDGGLGEAAVVQAAAACWANRLGINRNFALTVAGGSLTGGGIGQGATSAVDGAGIPTAGALTMDNDGSTTYFVDPTPLVSSEFTNPDANSQWRLLGGTNVDLFSVVSHEIGHALGWLCGGPAGCTGFTNPNYDALMNPAPGSFVVSATCLSTFPVAGQPQLAGCVRLVQGGGTPLNVSLRGDGLGTTNQIV